MNPTTTAARPNTHALLVVLTLHALYHAFIVGLFVNATRLHPGGYFRCPTDSLVLGLAGLLALILIVRRSRTGLQVAAVVLVLGGLIIISQWLFQGALNLFSFGDFVLIIAGLAYIRRYLATEPEKSLFR